MSVQRNFRVSVICTTGAMLLLALAPTGMCQTVPDQEVEPAPSDAIDEIIVYGNKSLHTLRMDLYMAEENVFAVFNSLNSDDEYDVHCYYEAPTGTRIKRRMCRANFVKELTDESAMAMQLALRGMGGPYIPNWARVKKKEKLLLEEMEALVAEHPELLEALINLSDAKQILESERQRRCEGSFLICRR